MRIRTKDSENHGNPKIIRIPKSVKKDIESKGFHLYKWISPEEVKLSIERDFLKTIKFVGTPLAVISVLVGLLSGFNLFAFFITVLIGVSGMFVYLIFLSLKRSFLLSKSAFVVLTDSSISLGGKIAKLSEISSIKDDIENVSETFEEDLFGESGLSGSKKQLSKQVIDQLFGGYETIFRAGGNMRGRDSAQGVLIMIALYTLYIAIMACVYFFGVLFLLLFGKLIIWVNTWYLLKRGVTVMKINDLFGDLDISSENIKSEKKSLEVLLQEAYDNNWQDGLLLAINEGIEQINKQAEIAILSVNDLRHTIENSRYNDMFSFGVYNGWIKKQIAKPLQQILELLEKNKTILEETKHEIENQIETTDKVDYRATLELQLKRVEIQIRDISRYVPMIEESISKLS